MSIEANTDDVENLEGLDPAVIAKRDEIAIARDCWRPCGCYRNPQLNDCMAKALAFVANTHKD